MGWDAVCPRICTWALVKKNNGRLFYIYNTHLDHKGEQSRIHAARLIAGKLNLLEPEMPFVLCGDLNAIPDSRPIKIIEDFYFEANEFAALKDAADKSTFNGFDPNYPPTGKKIDFIFLNNSWKVASYRVNDSKINGSFVSDHFAVEAVLVFTDSALPPAD